MHAPHHDKSAPLPTPWAGRERTRSSADGIGSGTVSNADWSRGYSCTAEKRALETIEGGAPKAEFMQFGDTIRIEMKGLDGASVFGAIEQTVAAATSASEWPRVWQRETIDP